MSTAKLAGASFRTPRKRVYARPRMNETMHVCTVCLARYPNTREYFSTASRKGLLRADCRWCTAARAHQQANRRKQALGLPIEPYRQRLPKKPKSFVATPVKPADEPLLKPALKPSKKATKRSPGVVKKPAKRKAPVAHRRPVVAKRVLPPAKQRNWFLRLFGR